MRTAEITLPGFHHDLCSAIHPLGLAFPFFQRLPLEKFGLEWVHPSAPLAHPFDDGTAALLERSIDDTSFSLGVDAQSYKKLMAPLVADWDLLAEDLLAPFHLPKHPLAMARFGWLGVRSAKGLISAFFKGQPAAALFAGLAAHAEMPLENMLTAAFGLVLGVLGHKVGWPMARGGAQNIADALAAYFLTLGGEIAVHTPVETLAQLPPAKAILCDITPKQLLQIAGDKLPERYKKQLSAYRYGPGVFKMDWALSQPIPWKASACRRAGTVHVGGTAEEIMRSERAVWRGEHPERPYLILAQQSLFDPERAPAGKHTAWGYCHLPNGSIVDMSERIEAQIERFAPGFRTSILARHTFSPAELQAYNANYIGGDINGGVQDIRQLYTRPVARWVPYSTPVEGLYICSSSTPPGGGVHGMCGFHAAQAVLKAQ